MVEMKEFIQSCWDCRDTCQKTLFHHCLDMGGKHVTEPHVKIMMDCIQMCQVAADFMTRQSNMHTDICGACAAVCEACATSCEEIGGDVMIHCAEICRHCAQECHISQSLSSAIGTHFGTLDKYA